MPDHTHYCCPDLAKLKAANDALITDREMWMGQVKKRDGEIRALQARVAELEAAGAEVIRAAEGWEVPAGVLAALDGLRAAVGMREEVKGGH